MEFAAGGSIEEGSADALVVGVGADRALDPGATWVAGQLGWLDGHFDSVDFGGKPGQVTAVPGVELPYAKVVFVGLGDEPDAESVRRAAGSAAKAVTRAETVATTLHGAVDGGAEAVALGFLLGQYRFDRHKSEEEPAVTTSVVFLGGDDEAEADAHRGATIAAGVTLARDLVNEPAVFKAPTAIAELAEEVAAASGLRCRIYDEADIDEGGMGGLAGVALGAANPARLVELWHEPEGATGLVAFVGKGIVFDSGGLSLKPPASMETMKTDMSGAAAVIGAMQVIAQLDVPVRVVGIAPLTENMPGGAAIRPGDVLRARNGKTIEVLNTDAEGRLVLADGLSLATEYEPDLVVDIATLTGACMVALGDKIAGLFGTDDGVAEVQAAADAAGERVWHLPLPPDYRKKIDSDVADMKNTGPRYGGAITAGLLLQEFVGDDVPWAHLDIAGPARASDAEHYITKGGTGVGVRTLVEVAVRAAET